jgi:antitoxin component YwqK of YwqJK toxin-antitoxin module
LNQELHRHLPVKLFLKSLNLKGLFPDKLKKRNTMKKLGLIFAIVGLLSLVSQAQDLKEVNGIYYADSTVYSGKYSTHFPNGKIKMEMNLENGMKNGTVNVYFENGQLNEVRSYKNNLMHGSWITYNDQKVLIGLANYKDGLKHGVWMIWDANGNLLYELHYNMGEKSGIWRNFGKDGEIISEREYPEKPKEK